jgi:hypothetical protein
MIDTILLYQGKYYSYIVVTSVIWMTNSESLHTLKMLNVSSICDPTNVHSVIQLIPYSF